MVAGFHLIWTAYGWWLPNDPRGSSSYEIRVEKIAETVLDALKNGGRIFFTGCGATGRLSILLDSVWRDHFKAE